MGLAEERWDAFRREADVLIRRLRIEGRLEPMRAVLARLLPAVGAMNLGDVGDCLVGEGAEREAFDLLDDLGCLAVLIQKHGHTLKYELFSKRQLAYVAENIDADRPGSES